MAVPCDRAVHGADGNLATVDVAAVVAVVDQFHGGQAAVFVHGVDHAGQVGDIHISPQAGFGERLDVAGGMEVALLGGDDAPAACSLHAAHGDHAVGEHAAHAVAVRRLIEPVWRCDRAYPDGFEQDIVTWITGHWIVPS